MSATSLPWCGEASVTTVATLPGSRAAATRASRPPCEWATMSTCAAPLCGNATCSMKSASCLPR